MRTLNRQRANLVLSDYFDRRHGQEQIIGKLLTPNEVSSQERIFERDGVLRWRGGNVLGYCEIGVSLRRILDLIGTADQSTGSYKFPETQSSARLLEEFRDDDYIMWYDDSRKTFLIVLKATSNTITQLHAWLHALLLAKALFGRDFTKGDSILDAIIQSHVELRRLNTRSLYERLPAAGWDVETGALETRSGTRIKKDEA
jgi:hypothetical protein